MKFSVRTWEDSEVVTCFFEWSWVKAGLWWRDTISIVRQIGSPNLTPSLAPYTLNCESQFPCLCTRHPGKTSGSGPGILAHYTYRMCFPHADLGRIRRCPFTCECWTLFQMQKDVWFASFCFVVFYWILVCLLVVGGLRPQVLMTSRGKSDLGPTVCFQKVNSPGLHIFF